VLLLLELQLVLVLQLGYSTLAALVGPTHLVVIALLQVLQVRLDARAPGLLDQLVQHAVDHPQVRLNKWMDRGVCESSDFFKNCIYMPCCPQLSKHPPARCATHVELAKAGNEEIGEGEIPVGQRRHGAVLCLLQNAVHRLSWFRVGMVRSAYTLTLCSMPGACLNAGDGLPSSSSSTP
jgi:hypothetical protein